MIAIITIFHVVFLLLGASSTSAFSIISGKVNQIARRPLLSSAFADQFKPTRCLFASSKSSDGEDEGRLNSDTSNEADFMSSLRNRVKEVQNSSTKLPLMVLDCMLPRQVLQIQIDNPTLVDLMRDRLKKETPTIGMLGMARVASVLQPVPLRSGAEVEIIQMEKLEDGGGWNLSLRAGRRFRITGEIDKTPQGWTESRVEFFDSREQEEKELEHGEDRMSVARAIAKCRQFTSPNATMENNASLVDRWIALAKVNERHPGQINDLLSQLGEIPEEHEPTERALWVGALINPLPAMGVAMEVRPTLLVSKSAEDRVQVALDGILKSIRHMDGTAEMW